MKKIIATVLAFVMILGTVAIGVPEEGVRLNFGLRAFAASKVDSGKCGENLTWTLDDEGTLMISGTGKMEDWDDYDHAPWYKSASSIKKVVIDSGVTSIGGWAFIDCDKMESVAIPDSVTNIGKLAFKRCGALQSVTIPNGVAEIKVGTFVECSGLTNAVIPESVTAIGDQAFYKSGLADISIPNSVASIGAEAFYKCDNLKSITIPKNVASIGAGAFSYCSELTEIKTDKDSAYFTAIDGILYNKDITELICCPVGKSGNVDVPEEVSEIGDYAFAGCTELTKITMHDGIKSIGESAFSVCAGLTSVSIPFGTESIGSYAFHCCNGLKSIVIPATVAIIDHEAFSYCSSLESVIIANGVSEIGLAAFYGCGDLAEVSIPDSVTTIDDHAFLYCVALTDVYYGGSEESWKEITVGSNNKSLLEADIHFASEVKDDENGVTAVVSDDDKMFEGVVRLNVSRITDASPENQTVIEVASELGKENILYDICFTMDGTEVQPERMVVVRIPVPEGFDSEKCKVYHIADDGTHTDMNAVHNGDYLVFSTDHFSYYAVVTTIARLPGDVNADGRISMLDSTVLRRWLAGWDVTISEANADVNGDGKVDMKDSVILRRYLAGWDGVELR